MKAISLWQPWESLWCGGPKIHETRHWPTAHRGWLAVHAAKHFEKDFDRAFADLLRRHYGAMWFKDLPRGAIIGAVYVTCCRPAEEIQRTAEMMIDAGYAAAANDDLLCGNFDAGRFGWGRREHHLLEKPIPWRGQQSMFSVPDDLFPNLPAIAEAA